MPSDTGHHRPPPLVSVSGVVVSYVHTFCGFLAFGGALFVALSLHYHKVVKNGVAGWPHEYWPSVSATIGDWYPERNLFQIGIALMSGPRFLLVFLSSMLVSLSKPTSMHSKILLLVGTLRTLACGGWVYVTSTDDHDVHDIMMGAYLILTPPWMFITSGSLAVQPNKDTLAASSTRDTLALKARKMRRRAALAFFGMTPFMVLFFYRHKVLKIPGAYTHYAFFEWGLIIFDLLFDCASMYDLSRLEIQVVEARASAVAHSAEQVDKAPLFGGSWLRGGTYNAVSSGAWSTSPTLTSSKKGGAEKRGSSLRGKEGELPIWNSLAGYAAEIYLSFMFWTSLTGLHAEIFWFSVYNMGIGGHEALLVIQVLALGVALLPPVQRLMLDGAGHPNAGKLSSKSNGSSKSSSAARHTLVHVGRPRLDTMLAVYAFCILGFVSWLVEDALFRLVSTALSCVGFSYLTTIEWGRAWETNELSSKANIWITGLLLSSLAKYANHSNNPAWNFMHATNGGQNTAALLFACLAITQRLHHFRSQEGTRLEAFKPRKSTSLLHKVLASCALGALIFGLHVLLSDSGTLIAWTWTGYPVKGPVALQDGRFLLLSSCAALALAAYFPGLALQPLFWVAGGFSFYIVYSSSDWLGFLGALGVSAFLPPLALPLLQISMSSHPIVTMWFAWLVADLMAFLQVLTAAYAFVPGGKIMRERTGLMIGSMFFLLTAGLAVARRKAADDAKRQLDKSKRALRIAILSLIAVAAQIVPLLRGYPSTAIQPYHPQDRVFTAAIWTVHFSLDQTMWDSTRRIESLVRDLELDVVGLLETDLHRTVFGNRDMTQYLSESLGMYADIGPGPDKHTWGAALLSKFPIINSTHHLLPSPNGELAPAIHAVLDTFGVPTHVVVSHNGQEEDPMDRALQTAKLAEIMRDAYPHPVVFLGYVVTKPHAKRIAPYEILFTDGRIHDVDPSDMDRWCEYIGFRALERVGYVRVSRYTVTDTEMQTAKFRVREIDAPPIDPDRDVRPVRTVQHPGVDVKWAYPLKFIDPPAMVYDKHKYSPYYWPMYFLPPDN